MKIKIEITATLQRVVEIEAENLEEAIDIAKEQYEDELIVLDGSDLVETKFEKYDEEISDN